jgi:hypothetical protein
LSGFPGKAILIKAPDDVYVRSRIFIDPNGPTLFQAMCVGSRELVDGADAEFFFDSYTID